ncbi:metallophosphoesterase family protein [Jatrophihabitans sp. DSM 45814]
MEDNITPAQPEHQASGDTATDPAATDPATTDAATTDHATTDPTTTDGVAEQPESSLRTVRRIVAKPTRFILTWVLRISLPLIFANVMLRAFPYRATVAGVPFRVQATLFTRRGFTADTTLGSWQFPHVDGLPFGVHISPEDVDLLRLTKDANPDTAAFVDQLKSGFAHQIPLMVLWLGGLALIGAGLGLAMAATINMAVRYLSGLPRRQRELRLRLRQLAVAAVVTAVVAAYGVLTFNEDWNKQSRLTGTLGAVQLFPSQLAEFYNQQSKAYNVLGAVVGIQAALQARIDQQNTVETAYNVMYISDMHLAAEYPLVEQYVDNFDVKLIVNTGDESEFGTTAEMTPSYLAAMARITKKVPMIWLAGNHDSPDTIRVMSKVVGVTVLGSKTRLADGSYFVTGSRVRAFGLTIAGVPDPRVYGADGPFGSGEDKITDPLERESMDAAVKGVSKDLSVDIFASHEPSATSELAKQLPHQIRQLNAGHTHAQNKTDDIQHDGLIDLVEGSTGAGGLDNISRGAAAPPVEFSIESVAPDCQFTKLLRFQLADPSLPTDASAVSVGDNVTVSSIYLSPQKITQGRACELSSGVSKVKSVDAPLDASDG